MKLLLASKEKFLIEKGYSFLDIPKDKLKIGYITTALSVVEDEEYLAYMKEYESEMVMAGIDFERIDIHGKSASDLRDFFADKNVIQVSGGNPFYLLKSMYESGFDKVLPDLLSRGLWYIGCSAGSYVMCPTIEVGAWKTSRNKYGVTDFTALGYVPFLIKCHYVDAARAQVLEKTPSLYYPLRVLRDDQAFLVNENSCTMVGNGEEVLLTIRAGVLC